MRDWCLLFFVRYGLSYTKFAISDLQLSKPVVSNGEFTLVASVAVANSGSVIGSEVVQLYVSLPKTSDLTHPLLQLRAFAKVRDLKPGSSERVHLPLDKYAVSYWDDRLNMWSVEKGEYRVHVGTSSEDLPLEATFDVEKGFDWKGIWNVSEEEPNVVVVFIISTWCS
jgi:beta-glucosidase